MSLRDAWNDGLEWADKTFDDVKEYATDKAISIGTGIVMDNYKKSITDAFGGPSKMTPELEAAGWKPGLDGIPYNPAIAYTAEDWANDQKNASANTGSNSGGAGTTAQSTASSAPFELSQDLRQRTPSGTIYNPSMDDYNNASLFEYTGPGGLDNYTYGEGLPTDYGIYGTPPGPNLYYEGQYGEGFVEPGVADTAIELPAVTMPAGVPQIPSSNASNKANNKKKDLTYAETIAEMGIAPGDAPSTLFPSPGNTTNNKSPYQSGMNPNLLNSFINEAQGGGLPGYTNNGTTSTADQAIFDAAIMSQMPDSGPSIYDTQYTQGANNQMTAIGPSIYDTQYTNTSGMTLPADESGIAGTQQFMPSGMTMPADESGIAGTQQFMPSGMTMPADESGIAGTQQQLPANTVINPFEDSMSQPIVGASSGNLNSLSTYSPTYGDPNNIASNYTYADTLNEGQEQLIFPEIIEEDENLFNAVSSGQLMDVGDIIYTSSSNEQPVIPQQYGLDEAVIDGYKYITNLFSGDEPSAEEVAESVTKEPSIWSSVMETIAGVAGNNFNPTPSNPPLDAVAAIGGGSGTTFTPVNTNDMFEYDGSYDNAPGSDAAIDAIVANSMAQDQAVAQASQASYTGPSIFTQPAAPAPVFGPAPRPTPRPTPRPVSRPTYTWKPDYANGRF